MPKQDWCIVFGKESDMFEVMRASMALWLVYGKTVEIDGEKYRDSYLSSRAILNIKEAEKLGTKKILVIDTSRKDGGINKVAYRAWLLKQSAKFRKNHTLLSEEQRSFTPNSDTEIFTIGAGIAESTPLNNDRSNLVKLFEKGRAVVKNNFALHEFLKDF